MYECKGTNPPLGLLPGVSPEFLLAPCPIIALALIYYLATIKSKSNV